MSANTKNAKNAKNAADTKDATTDLAPRTYSDAKTVTVAGKTFACRHITMPTINPGVGELRILRIDSPIRQSSYVDKSTADGNRAVKQKEPAKVCTVTNMETGEVANWLMPTLAYKELEEKYPEESYVGKIFAFQKMAKRTGKTYFDIQLAELIEGRTQG